MEEGRSGQPAEEGRPRPALDGWPRGPAHAERPGAPAHAERTGAPAREERTGAPAQAERPGFPVIDGQLGLATVGQLRQAGWTLGAVRHGKATAWQVPFPGVVLPHRGPVTKDVLRMASALWAGDTAVLTGRLALQHAGLTADDPDVATFLVPRNGRARSCELARTVRTVHLPPIAGQDGPLRIAGASRALVDAAQYEQLEGEEALALAISMLQRGMGNPDELESMLWQRPWALMEGIREGLSAFREGAWSRPELTLRRVVDGAPDLPMMVSNCRLETLEGQFVAQPDGYLPEAATAVQVHSRQFHQGVDDRGRDRWADTVERDSDLTALGVRVIGVAPWTLYRRPALFLRRLRKVVAVGLASPPPRVRVLGPDGRPLTW